MMMLVRMVVPTATCLTVFVVVILVLVVMPAAACLTVFVVVMLMLVVMPAAACFPMLVMMLMFVAMSAAACLTVFGVVMLMLVVVPTATCFSMLMMMLMLVVMPAAACLTVFVVMMLCRMMPMMPNRLFCVPDPHSYIRFKGLRNRFNLLFQSFRLVGFHPQLFCGKHHDRFLYLRQLSDLFLYLAGTMRTAKVF